MSIDAQTFRKVLGSFASGVTVVTTIHPETGKPVGVTVSAFSSLSMDPPLVLFCLGTKTASLPAFQENGHFCINVLSAGQQDISNRFASKVEDKFAGIEVKTGTAGLPVLNGCIATMECRLVQTVNGGDHDIFIGEIVAADYDMAVEPLIYVRGSYR